MNNSLQSILEHPLLYTKHRREKEAILRAFPDLKKYSSQHYLALNKYLIQLPQRYFSISLYQIFLCWIEKRDQLMRNPLREYMEDHDQELNTAFSTLEEINKYNWHDQFVASNDIELIRFIDQKIHPCYLKIIEAVLCPILRLAAHFSRIERGKKTEGLDIFNIIDELKDSELAMATKPYDFVMRNGIAHGSVAYLLEKVRYRDDKGNERTYEKSDIINNCDDLMDICNSLALALTIFFLNHQSQNYRLPTQLLIEELIEETKSPWWEILGCIPSEVNNIRQLNIYARSNKSCFNQSQISIYQSGFLAELLAPGYDRYCLSIATQASDHNIVIFNGKKLSQAREDPRSSLTDYVGSTDVCLFYSRRLRFPRYLNLLFTLRRSFKIRWPILKADFKKKMGMPDIIVRIAKIHRNSWGSVLKASIILKNPNGEITQDYVRRWCGKIVRSSLRYARSKYRFIKAIRHLPLGFACVSIFRKDYRQRYLSNYGLAPDLVCTIQVQNIKRISGPDIYGSVVQCNGKYRIAWNKAWLEEINYQQNSNSCPSQRETE